MTKEKMRRWLTWLGLAVGLVLCVVGISGGDLTIEGRDIVEADAGGGNLLAAGKGESLLFGPNWGARKYPFKSTAATLYAKSNSASDAGYLVVTGLNSSGNTVLDSVLLAGTTEKTFSTQFLAVNAAWFSDDSTNVGVLFAYRGSPFGHQEPDSILALVEPRQRKAIMAQMTMPAGRTQLTISGLEAQITSVFSGFPSPKVGGNLMGHYVDSTSAVHIGLLARRPGQGWEEIRPIANYRTGMGPVFVPFAVPEVYDLPGLTQCEVAAGNSGAAIDIFVRAKVGVK